MKEKEHIVMYDRDGEVTLIHKNHRTSPKLDPAFYKIKFISTSPFSTRASIYQDDSILIPKNSKLLSEYNLDFDFILNQFGDVSQRLHNSLNLKNKLAYILYGKQGAGKTNVLILMQKDL